MGNIIYTNNYNKMKQEYTLEDVEQHNKLGDGWMIINKKVYDVSEFNHPGGNIIKLGFGKDATDIFYNKNIRHSGRAKNLLKKYYIGELKT